MHAVTKAGRVPKVRVSSIHVVLTLASSITPARAQDGASSEKKAAVNQLEQLMREQQGLQMRQTQQLQSIRQQLDEQARTNAEQDVQWAGGLALIVVVVLSGIWLAHKWSSQWSGKWAEKQQHWREARLAKQQQRQAQRAQAATEQLMRFQSAPDEAEASSVEQVGRVGGNGSEVDHSGPGVLGHLLRRTHLRRALRKSRREENALHNDLPGATPAGEPKGPGWLAVLDEPDSQLLADEAVREFELRRAVGLQQEPELTPASAKAAQRQHAIDTESAWQAMEEISLIDSLPAWESASGGQELGIDVSLEVQRVRSGLRARREQRNLTVMRAAEPVVTTADATISVRPGLVCDIELSLPDDEATGTPPDAGVSSAPAVTSRVPLVVQPMLTIEPVEAPQQRTAAALEKKATPQKDHVQYAADASFSVSSLPAQTEAETRLALGYEFQKLGQHDEAAQLYEEVLAIGSSIDQKRAQQLLHALPGH